MTTEILVVVLTICIVVMATGMKSFALVGRGQEWPLCDLRSESRKAGRWRNKTTFIEGKEKEEGNEW